MRSSVLVGLVALCCAGAAAAEPMVGPSVGNADLLVAEGMRLYNEKQFAQAKDDFLKAARAAPASLPTYLSLARSWFALEQIDQACHSYKVFVRAAGDSPDRDKAQSELSLCERRAAAASRARSLELGKTYVNLRAAFFEELHQGSLDGPGSAAAQLQNLLAADYAAPDLGEMAGKLAVAAEKSAEAVYQGALVRQKRASPAELERAAGLYQLALDCGAAPLAQPSRIAFLQGMARMVEGNPAAAESLFEKSATLDPANKEALFNRGLARYLAGDQAGALRALREGLPDDPRTAVLGLSMAFDRGSAAAAAELERFLFARRFGRGQ